MNLSTHVLTTRLVLPSHVEQDLGGISLLYLRSGYPRHCFYSGKRLCCIKGLAGRIGVVLLLIAWEGQKGAICYT